MTRYPIFLLFAAAASGQPAAPPAAQNADDAPPSIKWERRGAEKGQAIIFLPALGFPGSSWAKVAAAFEKDHPVYLVTYAGTDGVPPSKPPYLGRLIRDVRAMIDAEHLNQPILAGHLLGAHVALSVAGLFPDAVGGVFCMPLIAPRPPPAVRRQAAKKAIMYYASGNEEMWEANLLMEAARSVENQETADEILKMLRGADRATYAGLAGDFLADTIEARLPNIQCPVALVALVSRPRDSSDPDTRTMKPQEFARTTVDRMRGLFPGLAKCDSMSIRGTRLVPLYDQPDRVVMPLERFVQKLANPQAHWGSTRDIPSPLKPPPAGPAGKPPARPGEKDPPQGS